MLESHYTSTLTLSRKSVAGNKTTFAQIGNIQGHLQPLSPTYQNGQWGRLQKEYRLFTNAEVRIGDKLEDGDGAKYDIAGVVHYSFRTGSRHYEAIVRGV